MKISQAYPSKYLKAGDIPEGREVPLKIADVQMETMEQTNDEKPVVYFIDKTKGLVLNVTNANTIADAYGDDTETWNGKSIVLFATTTSFQGKNVPCLRLRIPRQAAPEPQPVLPVQTAPATDVSMTDDCPF